jgi:hypothetical protein
MWVQLIDLKILPITQGKLLVNLENRIHPFTPQTISKRIKKEASKKIIKNRV